MPRYRKKPVTIEAFQLGIDYIPDWFMNKVTTNEIILHGTSSGFEHHDDTNADIKTLEGWHHASFGDFIIKGVKGEIYPCKPDIFEATYESADIAADVAPRSEVARLEQEIKALLAFKEYFSDLYGNGLEVANWHKNGALEPFDNFYESAEDEYEAELKKKYTEEGAGNNDT